MGLFDKIFRPRQARESEQALREAKATFKALTLYEPRFTDWRGAIYESAIVRAAIDARARHMSKLKIEIQGAANPRLQTKMRQGMNQFQTNSQFLYRASTILDCTNTLFVVPVFDADMVITGYYPVLPHRCEIVEHKDTLWLRYKFVHGQTAAVEFNKCAVLTKHQFKDDFFGANNDPLDSTMRLIHLQNQGIEAAVKNSAMYTFMATMKNWSKDSDLAAEAQKFTDINFADEERNGLLLFPNTYTDIKQIQHQPYTVDEKQMRLINENVYNYFGVNEDVLQNKAYGDAWSAFYEGAVEPFAIQLSEAMTKAMFTERERASGSALMVTSNRLQYLSNADKLAVSSQMADRGLMSINEIREIWNLPPVDGGDLRTVRGEYYTMGDENNAD